MAGFLAFLAVAAAGIVYLRHAKSQQEGFVSLPESLETIRTPIQRTTDPGASRIDSTAKPTSLAQMKSLERPAELDGNRKASAFDRIGPFETQNWTIHVRVIEAMLRADNDLYLVIEDGGLKGCVELPDPRLCVGSPYYARLAALRKRLDDELRPGPTRVHLNREATLTGVGFFGTGNKKDNGARLMPLLDLKWTSPGSR